MITHQIKGGKIDITDLISEKNIVKSASSRRAKNMMFLEDILKADGMTLMKWKHLYKEKGVNMKGKIPAWFKEIEKELLEDASGSVRKIKNEYIGWAEKSKIHIKYFDEN